MSHKPKNLHPHWRDDAGELRPGAPILAADVLLQSESIRAADIERIANDLGVPVPGLDAARDFYGKLVSASSGAVLKVCRGLSCQVEGAADFHERLGELLRRAGSNVVFEAVHCLDHCLEGPNIRFGADTFCSKSCVVVEDERTWRPADAGPRKVDAAGAPPVLD